MNASIQEFISLFKRATGASISVVEDNQAIFSSDAKYISLGENSYSKSAGVTNDLAMGDAYKITTIDNSVFILGGDDYGTLYGVYGLMEYLFDYEYYYKDTTYIVTKETVGLQEIPEMIAEPDFANRAAGYGTQWAENDVFNPNRYNQKIYTNYFAPVNGNFFHTTFAVLPITEYGDNTDWYNSSKTQLCYTAHGNSTSYTNMVSEFAKNLLTDIKANPDKDYIGLMGQDNEDVCTCTSCANYKNIFGTDSGAYILFANDVRTKVDELLTNDGVETDIQISILAYKKYYNAPTQNIPYLNKGVNVVVAAIEIEYNKAFTQAVKDNFTIWKEVAKNSSISFWLYDCLYSTTLGVNGALVPFDSFTGLQERYQFIQSLGAEYVFTQGQDQMYGLQTGFNNLKMYLNSKLAWDTEADLSTLTDKFFTNFYGSGASQMKNYYNALTAHFADMANRKATAYPYSGDWISYDFWTQDKLNEFKGYINNAISAIASLKETDSTTYDKLYNHIVAERIAIDYLLVKLYGTNVFEELKADIICTGIQMGGTSGEALYNQLIG